MKRNGKDTEYILRYLFSLQSIATYKADMMDYMTPYGLETRRQDAHDAMVEHVILPMLDADDKALVYARTKDTTEYISRNNHGNDRKAGDFPYRQKRRTCVTLYHKQGGAQPPRRR